MDGARKRAAPADTDDKQRRAKDARVVEIDSEGEDPYADLPPLVELDHDANGDAVELSAELDEAELDRRLAADRAALQNAEADALDRMLAEDQARIQSGDTLEDFLAGVASDEEKSSSAVIGTPTTEPPESTAGNAVPSSKVSAKRVACVESSRPPRYASDGSTNATADTRANSGENPRCTTPKKTPDMATSPHRDR